MNRAIFMEMFREDEIYGQLTVDDCLELFLTSLKGSSDLTKELMQKLFNEYGLDFDEFIKEE